MSSHSVEIHEQYVKKIYKDQVSKDMELTMLELLSAHDLAPKIHCVTENMIVLERCKGYTILEMLTMYDEDKVSLPVIKRVFETLEMWLERFHAVTFKEFHHEVRLTDFHYRNFIYQEGKEPKITGLDFERYEYGDITDNKVALLAWLSLYDFRRKDAFIKLASKLDELYPMQSREKKQAYKEDRLKKRNAFLQMKHTSCVILSGGQNVRMGSYKSELLLGRYTFMQHLLYQTGNFKEQLISANETAVYRKYGLPIIPDVTEQIGPIGGLYSALLHITTPYLFVVGCDNPYLPEALLEKMYEQLLDNMDGVVACVRGRINPLLAIYSIGIEKIVKQQIEQKEYRLMNLLPRLSVTYVEVGDLLPEYVYNINTKKAYSELISQKSVLQRFFPITTFDYREKVER